MCVWGIYLDHLESSEMEKEKEVKKEEEVKKNKHCV